MKYYACYQAPSSWEILSENEFRERMETALHTGTHEYLGTFHEYENLKEAKKYIAMHLKGDRDDAIMGLRDLRGMK